MKWNMENIEKDNALDFANQLVDEIFVGIKNVQYTEVVTEKGTGYYVEGNWNYGQTGFYVPPDISNVKAVVAGYPGSGQTTSVSSSGVQSYNHLLKQIKEGNAPDYLLVISPNMGNIGNTERLPNAFVNCALDNNIGIEQVGVVDFSASGKTGMFAGGEV